MNIISPPASSAFANPVQAASPTAPAPEPPKEWRTASLATFVYTRNDGNVTSHEGRATPKFVNGKAELPRDQAVFLRAGDSWDAAMKLATSRALESGPGIGQAQAVLQAADGAYWVTGLGAQSPSSGAWKLGTIDGDANDKAFKRINVLPQTADLQAIVGLKHIIDYRRQPIG